MRALFGFRIAKEGLPYFAAMALPVAAALALRQPAASLFFAFGAAGMALFFRDPDRVIVRLEDRVLSPADGTVVAVDQWQDAHGRAFRRVRIFLSIFDAHINRSPVAGEVTGLRYCPGRFLAAYRREAFEQNENNLITLRSGSRDILVRQIAGKIARRIVCYCRQGQRLEQGQRLGIIKFGSGTEVCMPTDAQVVVRVGQKVKAGETVIAVLK